MLAKINCISVTSIAHSFATIVSDCLVSSCNAFSLLFLIAHVLSSFSCSLDLLFCCVLVAVAVLACLRSLIITACRGYRRFLTFFVRDKIEIIQLQLAASYTFFRVILLWKANRTKKLYCISNTL